MRNNFQFSRIPASPRCRKRGNQIMGWIQFIW